MSTVYMIYRHGNDMHPFLYAYTDKKELRDSFLSTRKSKLFTSMKKELTKEQFTLFRRDHSSLELGKRGFETSSDSLGKTVIYITATAGEEMDVFINADRVFMELGKFTDPIAQAFNKKILKALTKLKYFEIYKMDNPNDFFVSGVGSLSLDERIDSLSIFLYMYGETIDGKGLLEEGNK